MKSILATLNIMAFVAIFMLLFMRSGAGEEMIKRAAKDTVREIVKEEIKKQLPKLPDTKWWDKQ